ncbi:hypothetical protein LshimejAT787_0700180 [Lyophyllum shimeji]|uniref:Uncharacterized protein n=1 Tax=Lyophyllum shimeji TaxID=47721 RepID=A0A9P3PP64_LYOSH|nr:hypothetical protein LshimejAT787_0700180 [Lyophyllum shimeji]
MTRSAVSPQSPQVAKKIFRANAKAQGLTFRAAAEARDLLPKTKDPIAPGMGRRSHASMAQTYWNGRAFVMSGDNTVDSPHCTEGPDCDVCAFEYMPPYVSDDRGQEPTSHILESLFDIAKPAKAKGVAKDFEIVESVRRVIAVDDEEWPGDWEDEVQDDFDWEEWEEAYEEGKPASETETSYSAVVKGKATPKR